MCSRKRITVEMVDQAYKITGLRPISSRWGDGVRCGCPIVAMYCAHYKTKRPIDMVKMKLWAWEIFGCRYVSGFLAGVDERTNKRGATLTDMDYHEGFDDGLAVRAAIF